MHVGGGAIVLEPLQLKPRTPYMPKRSSDSLGILHYAVDGTRPPWSSAGPDSRSRTNN